MPRWLQILLCLVLFAGAMLLVRSALYTAVPPMVAWLDSVFGEVGNSALIVAAFAILGAWVYREHRRQKSAPGP